MRAATVLVSLVVFISATFAQFGFQDSIQPKLPSPWKHMYARADNSDVIAIATTVKREPGSWKAEMLGKVDGYIDTIRVEKYLKGSGPEMLRVRGASGHGLVEAEQGPFVAGATGLCFLVQSDEDYEAEYWANDYLASQFVNRAGPQPWRARFRTSPSLALKGKTVSGLDLGVQLNNLFIENLETSQPVRSLEALWTDIGARMMRRLQKTRLSDEAVFERLQWFDQKLPRLYGPRNDEERLQMLRAQISAGLMKKSQELARVLSSVPARISLPLLWSSGPFQYDDTTFISMVDPAALPQIATSSPPEIAALVFAQGTGSDALDAAALKLLGKDYKLDRAIRKYFGVTLPVPGEKELFDKARRIVSSLTIKPAPKKRGKVTSNAEFGRLGEWFDSSSAALAKLISIEKPVKGSVDHFYWITLDVQQWIRGTGPKRLRLRCEGFTIESLSTNDSIGVRQAALQPGRIGLWGFSSLSPDGSQGFIEKFAVLPEQALTSSHLGHEWFDLLQLFGNAAMADHRYLAAVTVFRPNVATNAAELLKARQWAKGFIQAFKPGTKEERYELLEIAHRFGWRHLEAVRVELALHEILYNGIHPRNMIGSLEDQLALIAKAPVKAAAEAVEVIPNERNFFASVYKPLMGFVGRDPLLDKAIAAKLANLAGLTASEDTEQNLRNVRLIAEVRLF